jgi:hypothetical protein
VVLKPAVVWILIAVIGATALASLTANVGGNVAVRGNCKQIESLKERDRNAVIRSLEELPANAKALGLVVTEEVRETAVRQRDRALLELYPRKCSIWPWIIYDKKEYTLPPVPEWVQQERSKE